MSLCVYVIMLKIFDLLQVGYVRQYSCTGRSMFLLWHMFPSIALWQCWQKDCAWHACISIPRHQTVKAVVHVNVQYLLLITERWGSTFILQAIYKVMTYCMLLDPAFYHQDREAY